jgi:hypothetical protein
LLGRPVERGRWLDDAERRGAIGEAREVEILLA